jgi:hypothetical protein
MLEMMKDLFRDVVLIAIGANSVMVWMAVVMGNTDLMLLGILSLVACGLGLSLSDFVKDKTDD